MHNRLLLKEINKECRLPKYQFSGYAGNGKISARKLEKDDFIVLESMHNKINKIILPFI